ncbi:hypothetical protein N566_04215 [Streptomycetaceae bacterium MP113-05]|nr:hypothetical protein N566_04215 [Streptomycetaceae bacterium MP113-05]
MAASAALTQPATAGTAADHTNAKESPGCAVVYFDLGETLIHTEDDGSIHYLPDTARQLREMRDADIAVGLITNVPPEWGETDAARAAKLREIVDADWTGAEPFAWEDFEGRILTPRTVEERKPAPALFERGEDTADGCHAVYQGETPKELDVARGEGYFTYLVGRGAPWPAYLPVPVVKAIAQLP